VTIRCGWLSCRPAAPRGNFKLGSLAPRGIGATMRAFSRSASGGDATALHFARSCRNGRVPSFLLPPTIIGFRCESSASDASGALQIYEGIFMGVNATRIRGKDDYFFLTHENFLQIFF